MSYETTLTGKRINENDPCKCINQDDETFTGRQT